LLEEGRGIQFDEYLNLHLLWKNKKYAMIAITRLPSKAIENIQSIVRSQLAFFFFVFKAGFL